MCTEVAGNWPVPASEEKTVSACSKRTTIFTCLSKIAIVEITSLRNCIRMAYREYLSWFSYNLPLIFAISFSLSSQKWHRPHRHGWSPRRLLGPCPPQVVHSRGRLRLTQRAWRISSLSYRTSGRLQQIFWVEGDRRIHLGRVFLPNLRHGSLQRHRPTTQPNKTVSVGSRPGDR